MPDLPARAFAGAPANTRVPLVGRTLAGKYTLEEVLGEGAMGVVYKARQLSLEKTIAVKVMHLDLVSDETFAARFHREAKAASRLDHPNSIRILDFGQEADGLLYIAMEFLDGQDLLHVIEHESPISPRRIVEILAQVLSALAVAHEMGIIHRDLKPENIMILRRRIDEGPGEAVKVCDFGIAKVADSADSIPSLSPAWAKKKGRLTTAGLVVGTPEYMSPEQGRGDPLDARSDLYAVGVVLYYLLAGRIPFDAPTPLGIVVKHQHEDPIPPSSIRPEADLQLEEVCLRAMQKRPDERYAGAREMRSALHAAVAGLAETPQRVGRGGAGSGRVRVETSATLTATAGRLEVSWVSRFRGKALAVALGVVVLGTAAWYGTRTPSAPPEPVADRAELAPSGPAPPVALPPSAPSVPPPSLSAVLGSLAPSVSSALSALSSTAPPANAPVREIPTLSRTPRAHLKEIVEASLPASESLPVPETPVAPPSAVATRETPRSVKTALTVPGATLQAPRPFDAARARVQLASVQIATGGATPSSVIRVLSGVRDAMSRCYQASASESSPEGSWNLRVLTDDDGNISDARLEGPLPPAVKDCIASAVRGSKLDADTGAVTADIRLTFTLR